LTIIVHEILPESIVSTELKSYRGFEAVHIEERPGSDLLLDTGEFSVKYIQLNHKTPSFGYAFLEADSFNVQKDVLQTLGLEPGPWIASLKQHASHPETQDTLLQVGAMTYPVKDLSHKLLVRKKGKKITYLTDFILDEEYLEDIVRFAWESDTLFCEAAFLEHDREKARRTYHLTAKEAGILARMTHTKHLIIFHFSRRYQDYSPLIKEAKAEFPHVE
jgi:ribonuclease Z